MHPFDASDPELPGQMRPGLMLTCGVLFIVIAGVAAVFAG